MAAEIADDDACDDVDESDAGANSLRMASV